MSTRTHSRQLRTVISDLVTFNWYGAAIVALLLLFQFGGILLTPYLSELGWPIQQSNDVRVGVGFIAYIVVASLMLIGGYWIYKRFFKDTRFLSYLLRGILVFELLTIIGLSIINGQYYMLGVAVGAIIGVFGVVRVYRYLNDAGLGWIVHNTIAISMGVVLTAALARVASPSVVIIMALGLLVWDYVAVYLTPIMSYIVNVSSAANLPNYLIIPRGLRIDMSEVKKLLDPEEEGAEMPENVVGIIGVGDFAIPGLLAVSAAIAFGGWNVMPVLGPIIGTCAAVPVLTAVMAESEGGVPGLPWLNYGAITGFLAGGLFI